MSLIKGNAKTLFKSRFILAEMVKKNVKSQYRNSVLGIVWTVLNPLLNMAVLALVFSQLFGRGVINYPVFLLCGNLIFGLMRTTTEHGLICIEANRDLVTKVKIPYFVFPVSHLLSALVNFGFSFISLLIVMLVLNTPIRWTILLTIPFLPSLLMFSLGMALILCTMYVFFKDTKHLYGVFLTLWTYLTPLFYTVDSLPNVLQGVMQFNPMYHYVEYFRDIVLGVTNAAGEIVSCVPSLLETWICYGIGLEFLLVGILIFNSKSKKFILHL